MSIKINPDWRSKFIFHIVLWTIWIGFPFITAHDERSQQFFMAVLPITLTNIPLFLLNSEWLVPKIFKRKGLPAYLLSLLGLVVVFSLFQAALKEWLIPDFLQRKHWDMFWAFVPVIFVTAISTGYGLIVFLQAEAKKHQERTEERLQSEVSFLRSQISPHFIFNVLNSIVYLIRSKSEQAESVTLQLSALMRYMLYESGDAQVPLEKELNYLENYIQLQKIRFEEDVDIRLQTEGSAGSQFIEPMLLIPFVENAFKHGVGLVQDPVIAVFLKIEESQLLFEVANKIAPEGADDKDNASGIGLKNVRRRLELLYPHTHELRISQADGFFKVHLKLEFLEQKEEPLH